MGEVPVAGRPSPRYHTRTHYQLQNTSQVSVLRQRREDLPLQEKHLKMTKKHRPRHSRQTCEGLERAVKDIIAN